MKTSIYISIFGLIPLLMCAQEIACNSLVTSNNLIELAPMQENVLFSFNNIASNAIEVSQNVYVNQWVSFDDSSVVNDINNTLQSTSNGSGLSTYIYPSQTYELSIEYNGSTIPQDYSLQCYYNIYTGSDTCQIPFMLNFTTTMTIDHFEDNKIKIFPNPFNDYITIKNIPANCELSLVDVSGKTIFKIHSKETNHKLNLSSLNKGLYFMEIKGLNFKERIGYKKVLKLK